MKKAAQEQLIVKIKKDIKETANKNSMDVLDTIKIAELQIVADSSGIVHNPELVVPQILECCV